MSQLGLDMSKDTRSRSHRRGGPAVFLAALLVLGLLTGAFLGGRALFRSVTGGPEDFPGPGGAAVVVEIRRGDSARAIGERLAEAGVVASAESFVDAAEADGRSERLQAGFYRLRTEMRAADVVAALLDPGSRAEAKVTVPEGLRLGETVATLAAGTGRPADELTEAARSGRIGLPPYADGRAEGFLFPATYDFAPTATAEDMLRTMTRRFAQAAATVGLAEAGGRSPYEIVTIASLVEGEASRPEDFGPVARVVVNRLAAGMPLQFDSTVNYALGTDKKEVTSADLRVDSPYNTYTHRGLPPGPINSPGEAALRAAKVPPAGDWLYFVTVNLDTGETKFTADYAEFLTFKEELRRHLAQR